MPANKNQRQNPGPNPKSAKAKNASSGRVFSESSKTETFENRVRGWIFETF